jgi:hypothetical protein
MWSLQENYRVGITRYKLQIILKKEENMSGGHFDHTQHYISDIADEIENVIKNNDKKDEYEHSNNFPAYVIQNLKEGVRILRKARIYAQRADWLLSGDDGHETFLERLKEDLRELWMSFPN